MEVEEFSGQTYDSLCSGPLHAFNTVAFNTLNKSKTEQLYYLLFRDSKPRLGLIAGLVNNELRSPFSAPFGGFSLIKKEVSVKQVEEAARALLTWLETKNFIGIRMGLPPSMYHPGLVAKTSNALQRLGFVPKKIDLNYAFALTGFKKEKYRAGLPKNARKNLANALKNNLSFTLCQQEEEKTRAYQLIKQNRQSKGYPLRLTLEEIRHTSKIIVIEYFLVKYAGQPVAAAVVYRVSDKVAQVVYWGDLPGYAYLRPMNFMAYKIFAYYHAHGFTYVDVGPSTEDSIPNYGLCDFKESIGCGADLKVTWQYQLK